ncbi:IPT/TIG domain-containing protein [Streptomyces xinghaiensis]|uniref:IPT/TIG domain-containing protein n=1 Tax=Streptomyces xinghaiensis TaxID=1038928 RepID=UPI0037BBD108
MAPPVLSSVVPQQGVRTGGTPVTLAGSGFGGATAVRFGTTPAASFAVLSATRIDAVTPPGNGTVHVTVSTAGGTSTQPVTFTYVTAVLPSVTSVTPDRGPAAGGTPVTLAGSGFGGATAVRFGTTPAASFTVVSAARIDAVTPAGSPGPAAVTVTTPGGTSVPQAPQSYFYYLAQPALSDLSPDRGPAAGGTPVTLAGSGFAGATAVRFGTTPAASFTVVSATRIDAVAPAGSPGPVAVTVTTPGGTSNSLTYTWAPAAVLSDAVPAAGPTSGGTIVTLTGSGLTLTGTVAFGGDSAAFTVVSDTLATAVSPPGAAGTVAVTVTTPGGTSNGVPYTYVPPPDI